MTARMSDIEIKGHLQKLALVAQVALQIPADKVLGEFSHTHALGWIVDPTGYRDLIYGGNMEKNERGLRALAAFQSELRRIWPELAEAAS